MENRVVERFLEDEAATEGLGAALAGLCPPGTVLYLHGDLGTGKTTLVRGFVCALGHRGAAKSPTYTLVEAYRLSGRTVHHWDLYRLRAAQELAEVGVRDYLDGEAIWLVEWPERGGSELPPPDLDILLSYWKHGRRARLEARSEKGRLVLREAGGNDNPE
jgi:tRNA threonylcarbamoyladenosine biosynthesis protein TsaE